MSNDVGQSLRLLADGRLGEWRGLPQECPLSVITAIFPPLNSWTGLGSLGSDCVPARYAMVPMPGFRTEMRVWFRSPDDRVVLLDAEDPIVALPELREQLGEPEARLDTYLDILRLRGGEWVYPERGLALFVNPATDLLLRVALYARTTLDIYERQLRLDLELRLRDLTSQEER